MPVTLNEPPRTITRALVSGWPVWVAKWQFPAVQLYFRLVKDDCSRVLWLVAQAQNEAYGASEATEHDVVRLRGARDRGGLVALDLGTATGIGVRVALCAPPHRGVSELAPVGVGVAYRRCGIAAALTGLLARACPTVGITRLFLMPAAGHNSASTNESGAGASPKVCRLTAGV
jgi:hypothetical protein